MWSHTAARPACALAAALAVALAGACGGGGDAPPDGEPPPDAPPPDAPRCPEYAAAIPVEGLPDRLTGDLAGATADHQAPSTCAVVDAPFGVSSLGVDVVYRLDGLTPGADYVVRVDGDDDLAFYVMTGCGDDSACLLFVDAEVSRPEVGRFTAPAAGVETWLVVDYYAAGAPPATRFAVELYPLECEASTACGGDAPVCQDGRCVGCASHFDCRDPARPVCDPSTRDCIAGYGLCVGDDPGENGDDGPAGARPLEAGGAVTGAICNNPHGEYDFLRFRVDQPGEHWTITLDWVAPVDLDLVLYDERGELIGMSFYERPERVVATYLAPGDYYARVDYFASQTISQAVPYTVTAARTAGDACAGPADCAAEWRNQVFRGACVAGACLRIDGAGALGPGEVCDSASDCGAGTTCASFFFVKDADARMTCGSYCAGDGDCAALGADYVCTTYLADNFCVKKCAEHAHCPTIPGATPATPPWLRFSCQAATGRCLPP